MTEPMLSRAIVAALIAYAAAMWALGLFSP